MKSSAFIAASAAVILFLGLLHLLYTFRGPKLHPRDPDLTAKMMTVSPVISRETTMWRVWVGFNATHSFGLILFGALYGYLAMGHRDFLFRSCFLLALGFALLLGYAVIARLYFFTAPFRGIVVHLAQVEAQITVATRFNSPGVRPRPVWDDEAVRHIIRGLVVAGHRSSRDR